jgi:rare lipoprotein A
MKQEPMKLFFIPILLFMLFLHGCAAKKAPPEPAGMPGAVPPTQRPYKIMGKTYYPLPSSEGYEEKGIASWYGSQFHGRKTSNGEEYDMYEETAAHKTLPMNTQVLVKNLENGREMAVRINDRGPFVKDRIIDLSLTAARKLGIIDQGTAKVKVTALGEARTYRQGNREVARFLPHQDFQQGDFYVQIGSFTNKNNALRLQEKMKQQGNSVVMTRFGHGDSLFYRVQVHAGSTLTVARNMEKEFNGNGYPDAFVVARLENWRNR